MTFISNLLTSTKLTSLLTNPMKRSPCWKSIIVYTVDKFLAYYLINSRLEQSNFAPKLTRIHMVKEWAALMESPSSLRWKRLNCWALAYVVGYKFINISKPLYSSIFRVFSLGDWRFQYLVDGYQRFGKIWCYLTLPEMMTFRCLSTSTRVHVVTFQKTENS
jgi:hypothetical protein